LFEELLFNAKLSSGVTKEGRWQKNYLHLEQGRKLANVKRTVTKGGEFPLNDRPSRGRDTRKKGQKWGKTISLLLECLEEKVPKTKLEGK